jgi:hypothetical protein
VKNPQRTHGRTVWRAVVIAPLINSG